MNIYVGNLSYKLNEEDLKKAFEEHGEITSVKIIKVNTVEEVKDLLLSRCRMTMMLRQPLKSLTEQNWMAEKW